MKIEAKKEHAEREDDEAERLVRESPKLKPPRRDKRRETVRPDSDPDTDGDPDLKSKDKSLNYKVVGSIAARVAQRFAAEKVPAIKREDGSRVFVNPETLKTKPGEYAEIKEEKSPPSQETPSPEVSSGEAPTKKKKAPTKKKKAPVQENSSESSGEGVESEGAEEATSDKKEPDGSDSSAEGGDDSPPEAKEPSIAESRGIGQPKRREASTAERVETNYALAASLPPELAAKLIASKIHPDDAKELLRSFKAAQARNIGNVSTFASKLKGVYQLDSDKVEPPSDWKTASGETVAFNTLPPEEQAEAYRKHQMQVVAVSLAARSQMIEKLQSKQAKTPIDPQFLGALADTMLGQVKGSADNVFTAVAQSKNVPRLSDGEARRLLAAVKDSPEAVAMARGYLEASDYQQAKSKFLGDRGFSENDSPAVIAEGLRQSQKFFEARSKVYGATEEPHSAAKHFELQVLTKLKEVEPEKHAKVQRALNQTAAEAYDKAKKSYEKAHKAWCAVPVSDRKDPPKEPLEPFGYAETRDLGDLRREGNSLWQALLGRKGKNKTASASVAYRYLISSYLKGNVMAVTPKTRKALYHGIDPASNYPTDPYSDWQPQQARDMGESDYEIIIDSAEGWLKTPVLNQGYEDSLKTDQRVRAALDLAIESSPYNGQVDPQTYDILLARLEGASVPGLARAGVLASTKSALSDRAQLEKRIFSKFPPDSKMKGGGGLKVMLTGDAASKLKEDPYTVVALKDLSDAELQTLATLFKVKTAGEFSTILDTSFMDSGDTSPATGSKNGEHTMTTRKLSNEQIAKADNILGRLDKMAQMVIDKAASWGMPFDEAKSMVNGLDKIADETEAFIYGAESLGIRQAKTLLNDRDFVKAAARQVGQAVVNKAAAVLQRESDEPYMDTFKSPMRPHQTDADEPYMDAYGDDQSASLLDGVDSSGRQLTPEA
jgi:hypothetical protein